MMNRHDELVALFFFLYISVFNGNYKEYNDFARLHFLNVVNVPR